MRGIETMRMRIILYFLHFSLCGRHIRVAQLIKQLIYILRILRHTFIQCFHRIVLLAEQLSDRQTGIHDLHDQRRVIEFAADTATGTGHIQLTANVAVVQILHHRASGRRLEVQQPSLQTFLLGISTQHGFRIVIQTGQERLIRNKHCPCIRGLQHILTVLKGQFA